MIDQSQEFREQRAVLSVPHVRMGIGGYLRKIASRQLESMVQEVPRLVGDVKDQRGGVTDLQILEVDFLAAQIDVHRRDRELLELVLRIVVGELQQRETIIVYKIEQFVHTLAVPLVVPAPVQTCPGPLPLPREHLPIHQVLSLLGDDAFDKFESGDRVVTSGFEG